MHSQNNPRHPGRGRALAQRPGSRRGAQNKGLGVGLPPTRKIFNCICDDTALVAGVKKSTRNGIRQWVDREQIRLFVPLHALEQLDRMKSGSSKHADDVRDALEWLDDVTTKKPHVVTLQGGFETYENWSEVEKFTVPKGLFSEHDSFSDDLPADASGKLDFSDNPRKESMSSTASAVSDALSSQGTAGSTTSPMSPPTSPSKAEATPVKSDPTSTEHAAASNGVPPAYRPLFNYILWRIHQELDPIAALESFIFLCNDQKKVAHAKGFDIRTKRLEQLREAVNREERDSKNRLSLSGKSAVPATLNPAAPAVQPFTDSDGIVEASVMRTPPQAPAVMVVQQQPGVLDPDAFGRRLPIASSAQEPNAPRSPVQHSLRTPERPAPGSPVNAGALHGVVPGGFRAGSSRGAGRGGAGRGGTGRGGAARGRGGFQQPQGPVIDPNSFTRPRSGGSTGRGGQARKLWVPT